MKNNHFSLSPAQILTIIAPLAIIAMYTFISFTSMINNIINSSIIDKAAGLNEKVEYEVRTAFEPPAVAMESLAYATNQASGQSAVKDLLKISAKNYPICEAFYFATAQSPAKGGYQITSDDYEAPANFDHTTRSWFTEAVKAKGMLAASEPYLNTRTNKVCISFSQAVYNSKNRFIGVVGCDIMLDNLSEIINKIYLSEKTKAYILTQNGLYLTNPDTSLIMKDSYFDHTTLDTVKYPLEKYLDGNTKTFIQGNNFFAVRKLAAAPWYVVMEGPMSDFTGKYAFWLLIILIIVGILIFGNVIFDGYIMNKTKMKELKVSENLLSETQNLVVASRETAATSQDQSAAVKEIVATMEDSNTLSENISTKIKDVAGVATKTSADVLSGVETLAQNVAQLREIFDANQETIEGIKALSDKIENIWDIVTLINSVADQAKIIAFNAELEASSAGEAGKNFHIVATEIRRLADGIIDGTKEIKERINEIQQSSDSLIIKSESGTAKINEGCEKAKELESKFNSIKSSAEITATSSADITNIIQQQATASEQILITLKQISAGVENFTQATENISTSSTKLKTLAENLNKN